MAGDWVKGDLLRVVRSHSFAKGIAGEAPGRYDIFYHGPDGKFIITRNEIPEGVIVMAIDSCPASGKSSAIRVMHENGVWVANSNFVQRACPEELQ